MAGAQTEGSFQSFTRSWAENADSHSVAGGDAKIGSLYSESQPPRTVRTSSPSSTGSAAPPKPTSPVLALACCTVDVRAAKYSPRLATSAAYSAHSSISTGTARLCKPPSSTATNQWTATQTTPHRTT